MALFSDMDWVILLGAGALLLLGGDNRELLRTAGRLYGKVMRLRNEFLAQLRDMTQVPPVSYPVVESPPQPSAPPTPLPAPRDVQGLVLREASGVTFAGTGDARVFSWAGSPEEGWPGEDP